jgi:hypothetical protein
MGGVPLPEGYHSVNPYIVVDDAERLIDFLVEVFGATTQASLWLRTPPEPSRTPPGALWPRDDTVEPNGAPRWIDMTNTICRSYFARWAVFSDGL